MSFNIKSKSSKIVIPAIFASMSVFMTITNLVFPFPILPYLRFELAEIPVIMVFLMMGPIPGLTSSVIYWGILNVVGEWVPTILGLWFGFYLYKKVFNKSNNKIVPHSLSISFAILFRIISTSLLNYILLWHLFPFFLDVAIGSLTATVGFKNTTPIIALYVTLFFTAIFNIIHIVISIVPSYAIIRSIEKAKISSNLWINELLGTK
jgi:riboflavin transporter FmnP